MAKAVLFVFCCLADASVLRNLSPGRPVAEGQFRRGYFERFEDGVGLAADAAIRPGMLPRFALTDAGALAVPPGMIAVLPLDGAEYAVSSDDGMAPYLVIAEESPFGTVGVAGTAGEAQLRAGRTWQLGDTALALEPWRAARPWRDDAARLAALQAGCGAAAAAPFEVGASAQRLTAHWGRCTFSEARTTSGAATLLAVVAGPSWTMVARQPAWQTDDDPIWPPVLAIAAKQAATWWALGPVAAVAVSATLAVAALRIPEAAALTWPILAIVIVTIALLRGMIIGLAKLPRRYRLPLGAAAVLLVAAGAGATAARPRSFPPIVRTHDAHGQPDACAVIGYSTVKGEGLRGERGGIRMLLDRTCQPCRDKTGGLFAGGETLSWARDAYCASSASFGADGVVAFLGAANDDFMWGTVPFLRLLVVGQQGGDAWRRSASAAAVASRARVGDQTSALGGLIDCARTRGARFLFLHDFVATDLSGGRSPDRAAMLAARRAAVEGAGMTFVDLLDAFGDEVGVAWFNDYVHLSQVAQERIAALACRSGI